MSGRLGPVLRECVEGYLYSFPPLRLLILRRPPGRGHYWVPVSGKVEPSDVDFEAALRREVAEETGVANPLEVTDLDWHVPFVADNGETWRLHAYAVRVPAGTVPTLSSEHEDWAWDAPRLAARQLHFPDNREAVARLESRLARVGNV